MEVSGSLGASTGVESVTMPITFCLSGLPSSNMPMVLS